MLLVPDNDYTDPGQILGIFIHTFVPHSHVVFNVLVVSLKNFYFRNKRKFFTIVKTFKNLKNKKCHRHKIRKQHFRSEGRAIRRYDSHLYWSSVAVGGLGGVSGARKCAGCTVEGTVL